MNYTYNLYVLIIFLLIIIFIFLCFFKISQQIRVLKIKNNNIKNEIWNLKGQYLVELHRMINELNKNKDY